MNRKDFHIPVVCILVALSAACDTSPKEQERVEVVSQPMSNAEILRRQSEATEVDTIITSPEQITLRVGETYPIFQQQQVQGLDVSSQPVAEFAPSYIFGKTEIIRVRPSGIEALRPGEATVYLEAFPRSGSEARVRPSTAVRVLVES